MISWDGRCKHSVEERVRAMKNECCPFMKYWERKGVRLKTRVLIFRSVVCNIALSGLEACAMEKIQEERLEKEAVQMLKKLPGTEASYSEGEGRRWKPDEAIRERVGKLTVESEIRRRKMKRW